MRISIPSSVWRTIGVALAKVASGALTGAKWASDHPDVVDAIGKIAVAAGAPAPIVDGVETGVTIAGAFKGPQ